MTVSRSSTIGLRGLFARRGAVSEIAALYAAMERGINEVYRIVEGWGWTLTG